MLLVAAGPPGGSPLDVTIVNSTFAGNKADVAGAIHFQAADGDASATIVNSTFRRNRAAIQGGALFVRSWGVGSATATLRNAILWGNSAGSGGRDLTMEEFAGPGTVMVDADHCDIGDRVTVSGTFNDLGGNIDADPSLTANYHLRAGSPAIDAGTCTGAPATDFEGDPRPVGSTCDIGADEFLP